MLWDRKKEAIILCLGDLACFVVALALTIFFRYFGHSSFNDFIEHLAPFSVLFIISILVFFVAGLYGKQARILQNNLLVLLFYTQIINALIAIAFFYFIPAFGIEPKTNLFIYLLLSSVLIFFVRLGSHKVLGSFRKQSTLIIGRGEELKELHEEIHNNPLYPIEVVGEISLEQIEETALLNTFMDIVKLKNPEFIVIDTREEKLFDLHPYLHKLGERGVRFIDFVRLFGETFDRVPLSTVNQSWFKEFDQSLTHLAYDTLKRLTDIGIAFVLAVLSLPVYPFVYVLVKVNDGGPVFFKQERVGQYNKKIFIRKFRTMRGDGKEEVTAVGRWLRIFRIDELPQLWNVVKGDLALVGPRPEIPSLTTIYNKAIPYYSLRHIVKPGLSGWAQIHDFNVPRIHADVDKTIRKLSYDLYYLKHRSFILDLKIALWTVRTLLSRSGV